MSISVLIVDDHRILRDGLRALLERESDIEVCGEARDGRSGLELAKALRPQIVVMDLSMPDMNGVEATLHLRTEFPRIGVVALSAYSERRHVLEMLDAGAQGFVIKACAAEELVRAIRVVAKGSTYLSPPVAGAVVDAYVGRLFPDKTTAYDVLAPREREVVQLLSESKTSKEIGFRMHISVKTVEAHRRNIMRKLDLHSIAALTKYAVREGLTSLD